MYRLKRVKILNNYKTYIFIILFNLYVIIQNYKLFLNSTTVWTALSKVIICIMFSLLIFNLFHHTSKQELDNIDKIADMISGEELIALENYIDYLFENHRFQINNVECLLTNKRIFRWSICDPIIDIYLLNNVVRVYLDEEYFIYIFLKDGSKHMVGNTFVDKHCRLRPFRKLNKSLKEKIEIELKRLKNINENYTYHSR